MKVIAVETANVSLPDVAELARSGTVILTRKGKPLAAVKDLSGADWESLSLANNPRFRQLIEASRRSYRDEGGIGLEEIRQEFGLKAKTKAQPKKKR